jgi:hypothetical protein
MAQGSAAGPTTQRLRAIRLDATPTPSPSLTPPPAATELRDKEQLAVVVEMMDSIDTLTIAGQRHMMMKVVRFLERQLVLVRAGERRPLVFRSLGRLAHEAERQTPNPRAFNRRAAVLVSLIRSAS